MFARAPWQTARLPFRPTLGIQTSAEGIGEGLKTKINVNLGISGDCMDYTEELKKAEMAVKMGAEAIINLQLTSRQ